MAATVAQQSRGDKPAGLAPYASTPALCLRTGVLLRPGFVPVDDIAYYGHRHRRHAEAPGDEAGWEKRP